MKQRLLFAPLLIECATCGWSWREGDSPPPPHRACVVALNGTSEEPQGNLGGTLRSSNGRAVPLKKWRCSKCWSRFGRPREERHPLCAECRAGDVTLFGPRALLVPEHARPIAPRKRKRRTG